MARWHPTADCCRAIFWSEKAPETWGCASLSALPPSGRLQSERVLWQAQGSERVKGPTRGHSPRWCSWGPALTSAHSRNNSSPGAEGRAGESVV